MAHPDDLTAASLETRAARIQLLLFDVDGVLTDGTILLHGDGSESKSFHIRDGAALVWAQWAGLRVGFLSARNSGATAQRAAQLAIRLVVQGVQTKLAGYEQIVAETGLADDRIAYMGDDLLDIPVLSRVGLAAAPADAVAEVRACAQFVSAEAGGRGAARALVELVLRAQRRWDDVLRQFA
ncbi:MAG TPA: HAD hydrolase family protein [Vicinamibacterales bacterium]|nr:HAD hydrolase family protein [Vicinamibacterales bacterium]